MKKIAIVNYGMGNLQSVLNVFNAVGAQAYITNKPEDLSDATGIVLPGVGAFSEGINNLKQLKFEDALRKEVIDTKKPYLGICLGMQFLAEKSFERGSHNGFGWIKGYVKKIEPAEKRYRIPHIGWNNIEVLSKDGLFSDIVNNPVFYFVHSYHFIVDESFSYVVTSRCWHGEQITASIQYKNIFGVQFHPEKSQGTGLHLIKNFVDRVKNI